MTSNNQPESDNSLEDMLARYSVAPNDPPETKPKAADDDQPLTRRERKSRQNNGQHDDMEDQSFWNRARQYVLPAVLVLGVLLSLFTNLF